MINYVEKGYSMHEWLANKGAQLTQSNGIWSANAPDDEVNKLIAEYNPWAAEKSQKLTEINSAFSDAVAQLTAGTMQAERDSWSIQESEARGYPDKPTPRIEILAAARGVPLQTLVEKILYKANLYAQYYFTLQGERDALEDLINALPDFGEIERLPELWAIKFGS